MNSTIKMLQSHRSIRRFTAQKIKQDLFAELLKAGQSAATSSFIQATTVIRVTDQGLRERFVEISGGQPYVGSAAEFLVFCADLNRNKTRVLKAGAEADFGWAEQFLAASVDVALFAQNVVAAAESEGLGCCYIGGIRNDPDEVSKLLKLPGLVYPVFGLCLGYPDQDPEPKPRLPLEVVCHENDYRSATQMASDIDTYDEQVREYYQQRSGGKMDFTWTTQMRKQSETQKRPFMREFLNKKGFIIK